MKKYDLYITYPDGLSAIDQKLLDTVQGIAKNLQLALSRLLKKESKVALKGSDFKAGDALEIMKESEMALVFVHPKLNSEPEYQHECESLGKVFGLLDGEQTLNSGRVFKICMEPFSEAILPGCIENLLAYDFFEKNIYNRRIVSLNFDANNTASSIYGKILDLAFDMSRVMQNQDIDNKDNEHANKSIFLALTTFDQLGARDEIRRELLHYGYRVLPAGHIPMLRDDFEASIRENLEKSDIVIQLMGVQYGDMLKGTKYSVMDYQNRLIREYQQADSDKIVQRFIWIPQNSKIGDQRQALYLKRMRRDDASDQTEIIESPLETFKTILAAKLEKVKPVTETKFENISKVYLLTEEDNTQNIEELNTSLSLSGLKVKMLDYQEQAGIYARHLQLLRDSDAVIIYQSGSNSYWLNSKLRDLIKAPGLGRKEAFKKVLVITEMLPDAQLIRMIKSKVEVVDKKRPEADFILQKLISE